MKSTQGSTESFGAAILCCLLAGCNFSLNIVDGYNFDYSGEKEQKNEAGPLADGIRQITVDNRFGNLSVVSAVDGDAGWNWDATCWADTEDLARTHLDALVLNVETTGDSQSWKLVLPESKSDLNGVRSDLTIRVPDGLQVKLVNAHGGLNVADLEANLEAFNSHGNVELSDLTGKSVVTLAHGDAEAERVSEMNLTVNHGNATLKAVTGDLSFDGSHGNFVANHVEGEATVRCSHMSIEIADVAKPVELSTSHESIVASELQGGAEIENSHGEINVFKTKGNLNTTNQHGATRIAAASDTITVASQFGRVEIKQENPEFQSIRAETSHGDLVLSVPESTRAKLELNVTHGKEKSDLVSDSTSARTISLKNSFGDIRVEKQSVSGD